MLLDNLPKITIVTVCLNAAHIIDTAISSVLNQTYSHIEYLVIDGGSNDGTVEILNKYQQQNVLKYISEPDEGVYDAMNKGVRLATGDWIFFLGSDDILYDNEVLDRIFSTVYDKEQILYGNVKFLHSGIIYDGPFNHEKISVKNICHQAMFVKKEVFEKIGLFNRKYKMSSDYEFNIRWFGLNLPSFFVNEIIVLYNEKGMSGKIWDQVFHFDMDELLIENNIISHRSFTNLKKKHQNLLNSDTYKLAQYFSVFILWLKNKKLLFIRWKNIKF